STSTLAPGMLVTGTNILPGTTIKSVDSATQITLSAKATATGTGSTLAFTAKPTTGTTQSSSAVVSNLTSTNALAPGMVVTGTDIPAGTTIKSVDSATQITLSAKATATGTGSTLAFTAGSITGTTNSASAVVTNLSSTTALAPGMLVSGTGIPAGAAIKSVDSATQITLSAAPTATGTKVTLAFTAGPISGNTTLFSFAVTSLTSTSALAPGMLVSGTDILPGTTIASVDSATQITLSAYAIATGAGSTLVFTANPITGTTTNTSAVVTSLTSTSALAPGMFVSGPGIASPGTTIQSVDSATQITLSGPATATGSGVTLAFTAGPITGNTQSSSALVTSLTSTSALAPGMLVTGTNILPGTTIKSVDSATQITLSANATATGTGSTLVFTANPLTGNTTRTSAVVTNVSSTSALAPGMLVSGTGISAGTTIRSVDSATQITLSAPATATGTGVALAFTAGPITGNTTSASAGVTNLTSTGALAPGMLVFGAGIPAGTTIRSVDSLTQITLSASATATSTVVTLAFTAGPVTGTTQSSLAIVSNLTSTSTLAQGMLVSGAGISPGTTIASVDSATQITLSAPATANGTGVTLAFAAVPITGNTTSTSAVVTSLPSTSALAQGMLVSGTGISPGTTIKSVDSLTSLTLSAPATATGTGVALAFATGNSGTTTLNSLVVTSVTSATALKVGMRVGGAGIPPGTTISSIDATNNTITLSAAATTSGKGVALEFATSAITGNTTNTSAVVTNLTSTSVLALGMLVSGTGIPTGTIIKSVDSPTQITLSAPATATGSGVALAFATGTSGTTTLNSSVITNVTSATALKVGMLTGGPGIPAGTTISSIDTTSNTITLSAAATTSGAAVPLAFSIGEGAILSVSTAWSAANVLENAYVSTTTNISLTGLQTIDGVLVTAAARILVKNQADPSTNGVYIAAAGTWSRADDADTAAELPRATSIYVTNGTQNGKTAWNLDNSIVQTASLTKDSAIVSGLFSTKALKEGMLVIGAGIPANTTIAAVNSDGTSVRLSANATLTGTNVPLSFVSTQPLTLGTSPIRFLPVGGQLSVT
ncbi:MAG: hypothetical protein WCJ21_07525, partial [Planctomycetota bacterium]